jgi:hypothetical protein
MRTTLRPAVSTRNGAGVIWGVPLLGRVSMPRFVNARFVGLVIFAAVAATFLAYMVANVPLVAPRLSREEAGRYWYVALIGGLVVLAGVALVVTATIRIRQATRVASASSASPARARSKPIVPRSLTFERVPGRIVAVAVGISVTLVTAAAIAGAPLWVGGLAFMGPLLPLVAREMSWKYARYGVFAMFALICLLQVAHMGEHSMQVGQLMVSHGDLASSHGVFGQLDFELVHFVTDTTLWIILGLLLLVFKGENKWLWVAFAAASLHQVEHFYLFWLNSFQGAHYAAGGFAGIMGENGIIGSPLDRPYLHFTYNLIVVVPMVIALWDQARKVDERFRTQP